MSGMFGAGRTRPRHKSVEWYTPAWIFDELGLSFDIDPCSPHDMESNGDACADALERMASRGVYLRRARHAATLLAAA